MARFDGKNIVGLIGKHVFKKSHDGKNTTIQMKPIRVRQTENSKKSASVMGNASSLSKAIRMALMALVGNDYPGTMVNQLTKANQTILGHCFDKTTKTYRFQQHSFHNLAGFEFNDKSPLSAYLWVQPKLTLLGNTMTLTIPEFNISDHVEVPSNANAFSIGIQAAQIALHESMVCDTHYFTTHPIDPLQPVPEQKIDIEVQDGCLCLMALSIQYFKIEGEFKKPIRSKEFNPAAIVDAIVSPGQFVEPPYGQDGNRRWGTGWSAIDKLKLPKFADE